MGDRLCCWDPRGRVEPTQRGGHLPQWAPCPLLATGMLTTATKCIHTYTHIYIYIYIYDITPGAHTPCPVRVRALQAELESPHAPAHAARPAKPRTPVARTDPRADGASPHPLPRPRPPAPRVAPRSGGRKQWQSFIVNI